ncbi:14944_t:CDS:1, partial [Cetraspora pellucida]
GQEDDIVGNINDLNIIDGNDNAKTSSSHSNATKRGRKSKSGDITNSGRSQKKLKSSNKKNNDVDLSRGLCVESG